MNSRYLLAKACQPPTAAGLRVIRHIYSNRLPVGLREWPADVSPEGFTDSETSVWRSIMDQVETLHRVQQAAVAGSGHTSSDEHDAPSSAAKSQHSGSSSD